MNTENTNGNCQNLPLHYIEQIALNKGGIACLDGRVSRAEADIRERYTKDEVNCIVSGKADKCAFEKHLLDCHKCCKPICDCDCYTKDEVDALLENKANIEEPVEYALELLDGYQPHHCTYSKDSFGRVFVALNISTNDNQDRPLVSATVGMLPEGFRPRASERAIIMGRPYYVSTYYVGTVTITPDGSVSITIRDGDVSTVHGQINFLATQ